MAFIDERIPVAISYGSGGVVSFKTRVATTSGGKEVRTPLLSSSRHSLHFSYKYLSEQEGAFLELKEWFLVCMGMTHSFRAKDWGDYKSCLTLDAISATDQLIAVGDGAAVEFQLIKTYSKGGMSYVETIEKPVAGTTVVAVSGVAQTSHWAVNTSTGKVTFDADIQKTCTGATQASATELSFTSHGLVTGDSAYLSGFTGEWAVLNGLRFTITKTGVSTLTVPLDSSGFAAYSGNAGQFNTIPQVGESVSAGYEYDLAVRFDTDDLDMSHKQFQSMGMNIPLKQVSGE